MKFRVLLAFLLGAILVLISPLLKSQDNLPFAEYATVQAQPKVAPQAEVAEYLRLLRRAAQEPELILAELDELAFSQSFFAIDVRSLAQTIRVAQLQGSPAYTFTAVGQFFARNDMWELSFLALQNAVATDTTYAEAWAYLGEAQQQTGGDGAEALNRARALNPLSLSANLFQALYWQRQDDFEEAARYLQIAVLIEPGNPDLYIQLGHNSVLSGDVPDAKTHYEKALAIDPENLELLKILAAYSLDNQIYVEELGLPAARRALLLAPRDPKALVLMGRAAFLSSGAERQAKDLFERAIELAPDHPAAHLHLGLYLIAGGEFLLAREHFEHVLLTSPGSTEAVLAQQVLEEYFP